MEVPPFPILRVRGSSHLSLPWSTALLSAEFSWGMVTRGLYGQSPFQPRCFGLCRKLSKFPFLFYCLDVQDRLCKIWLIKGYSLNFKIKIAMIICDQISAL